MAEYIVIIHGLGPKPPLQTLSERFLLYLGEGAGTTIAPDRFQLVYWADQMGYAPLTPAEDEYNVAGSNFKPYSLVEELVFYARGKLRQGGEETLERTISVYLGPNPPDRGSLIKELAGDVFSAAAHKLTLRIYDRFLPDLRRYFVEGFRDSVQAKLRTALQAVPGGSKVCLIAHSMGSIIALDLLLNENQKVDTFITIGSPLGISVLQNQIGATLENRAALPSRIGRWFNFYDRLDKVALDHDLNDDYPEIPILDTKIQNEFVNKDHERNHHKSYGYLRNPLVGDVVKTFS